MIIHGLLISLQSYRFGGDHAYIVEHAFSVEEIVGGNQHVPGQGAEPGQVVNSINRVANGNDFLKTFDLNADCL